MFCIFTSIYRLKTACQEGRLFVLICTHVARACYSIIQQKDQPSQLTLALDDDYAATQVSDSYWAQFYYRQTTRQ